MALTVNHQTNDISNVTGTILVNGVAVGGDNGPLAFFGTRGIFAGGLLNSGSTNRIEYVTIASPSNATDFGDLSEATNSGAGVSNGTRGCIALGNATTSGVVNIIEYITIANTGNSTDFGDLTDTRYNIMAGNHGVTRGIFGGGRNGPPSYTVRNTIDYITVATTGNATDFGDLTSTRTHLATAADGTRALFAGGNTTNIIDYVTVDTTGNATDFGDLQSNTNAGSGVGDGTYGVFKYGANYTNTLGVVTIQTAGNATTFGTLGTARYREAGNVVDGTYGLFAGGRDTNGTKITSIEYITVATLGNASSFGNLTEAKGYPTGLQGT